MPGSASRDQPRGSPSSSNNRTLATSWQLKPSNSSYQPQGADRVGLALQIDRAVNVDAIARSREAQSASAP
jgi:hypothetical protein